MPDILPLPDRNYVVFVQNTRDDEEFLEMAFHEEDDVLAVVKNFMELYRTQHVTIGIERRV